MKNKVIVIIGVSSGIGCVMVVFFVEKGVKVVLGVCRKENFEELVVFIVFKGGIVIY